MPEAELTSVAVSEAAAMMLPNHSAADVLPAAVSRELVKERVAPERREEEEN